MISRIRKINLGNYSFDNIFELDKKIKKINWDDFPIFLIFTKNKDF